MKLLKNAIEAIQVGVEDYNTGSRPRLLASVRNVYAGLLLMYKEALRRRSPQGSNEVLIKAQVEFSKDPSEKIVAVGRGKKTVDVRQIKERFATLGIETDWRKFESIQRVRNDVEHYYPRTNAVALRSVIANTFVILKEFIETELHEDPILLLGTAIWDEMLRTTEVYEAEQRECEAAINSIDWGSQVLCDSVATLCCKECGSELLIAAPPQSPHNVVSLKCRACGNDETSEQFIPRAIAERLSWEQYLSMTDGDVVPYVSCPECSLDAYVISEGRCAYCGAQANHTCWRCGSDIPPEELENSPLCGLCAHITSKND